MIVQCPNCQTKFNLDDSRVPAEGAWMRCSNCQHVFQAKDDAPAPPPPAEAGEEQERLDLTGSDDVMTDSDSAPEEDLDEFEANFGLDANLGEEAKPKGALGRLFKVLFWVIAILVLLGALAVGGLVAMDRLGVAPDLTSRFASVPGLGDLLHGGAGGGKPGAKQAAGNLVLEGTRGVFRVNKAAGRIFVISGLVRNRGTDVRTKILVRGRLTDAKGKVMRQAVVYAGPGFSQDELKQLSMQEIQARLGQANDPDGKLYTAPKGGSVPFTIVFANLPDNVAEFTAEVVGSEVQPPTK